MARKDITDKQVIDACNCIRHLRDKGNFDVDIPYLLEEMTGQPEKVCYAAMERAADRGFIEYGVSIRTAWPTDKGLELLASIA